MSNNKHPGDCSLDYVAQHTLKELLRDNPDCVGRRLDYIASLIRQDRREEIRKGGKQMEDCQIPSSPMCFDYMQCFIIHVNIDKGMVFVVSNPGLNNKQGKYLLNSNSDKWEFLNHHSPDSPSFTEQGIDVMTYIDTFIRFAFDTGKMLDCQAHRVLIPIGRAKKEFNRAFLKYNAGYWHRSDTERHFWTRSKADQDLETLMTELKDNGSWKQGFYDYYNDSGGDKKKLVLTMRANYELQIKLDDLVKLDGPTAEEGAKKLAKFFEAVIETVEKKIHDSIGS